MTPGQQWYAEYLKSEHWQRFRARIMLLSGYLCEICYAARCTEVHHVCYDRVGNERDDDVVAACRTCHKKVHAGLILRANLGQRADKARRKRQGYEEVARAA